MSLVALLWGGGAFGQQFEYVGVADSRSLMILHYQGPQEAGDRPEIPIGFSLAPNYPNPFNAQTTIEYSLPRATIINLTVYDIAGRAVATIAQGIYPAGYYRETWNATGISSGVYFIRLQAGEYREARKMVLVK